MPSRLSDLLKDRTAAFGATLVALVAVSALLATPLASFDPVEQDRDRHYQTPGSSSGIEASRHLLGTDALGRDILSRTLHGARFSLATAVVGAALAPEGAQGGRDRPSESSPGSWVDSLTDSR